MGKKNLWAWVVAIGIGLVIIGGLVAFIPYVGLPLMGAGVIAMIGGSVMLIPILMRERSRENREMMSEIDERELRP